MLEEVGKNGQATLNKIMTKLGTIPSEAHPRSNKVGKGYDLVLIAIYVDDMIIASEKRRKFDL